MNRIGYDDPTMSPRPALLALAAARALEAEARGRYDEFRLPPTPTPAQDRRARRLERAYERALLAAGEAEARALAAMAGTPAIPGGSGVKCGGRLFVARCEPHEADDHEEPARVLIIDLADVLALD